MFLTSARTASEQEIKEQTERFFADLFYEDIPYYVVFSNELPYLTRRNPDDQYPTLFVFSDLALADSFITKNPDLTIKPISPVEIIQITKTVYSFCDGIWTLNDNDEWFAIPFPSLLEVFYKRLLEDDSLCNNRYTALLAVLHNDKNYTFSIEDGACNIFSPDSNDIFGDPFSIEEIKGKDIPVILHTSDSKTEYTVYEVKSALTEMDKLSKMDESVKYEDWLKKDLSLTFPPEPPQFTSSMDEPPADIGQTAEEPVIEFMPEPPPVPDEPPTIDELIVPDEEPPAPDEPPDPVFEEIPEPEPEKAEENIPPEPKEEPEKRHKAAPVIPGLIAGLKAKREKMREKVSEEKKRKDEFIDELVREGAEEGQGSEVPEPATPEPIVPEPVKEETSPPAPEPKIEPTPEEIAKKKKRRLIFSVCAITAAVILCLLSVLVIQQVKTRNNFKKFCSYIDSRDYGNAYAIYTSNRFYKDGDEYLSDAIDDLILGYAKNELTAEEVNASLNALSNFRSVSNDVSAARLVATKLEESKNAYVQGKNSADVYTRLSNWQKIITLDEVNYLAATQNIQANAKMYESTLGEEIEYYSTRSRNFAQKRWQVLQYWYPDCETVGKWASEYEEDSTETLSMYPIKVEKISLAEGKNGYWSLRIDWHNVSAKTIANIRFSLVAFNEKGEMVRSTDSHGTWSIFDAKDPGPFGPGEGHDIDGYLWHNAWFGTDIAKASLTGVYIEYKDGTTASFTQETDLIKIQN